MAIGFARGPSRGSWPIVAGVSLCVLAVLEVTLREHLSGYRSHSLLLGLLAVVPVQLGLYLLTAGAWSGLLAGAGDAALFAGAAWLAHRRFRRVRGW